MMAILDSVLDLILDRTGSTGSTGATVRSKRLEAARDAALLRRPKPPTYTTIITPVGTRLVFNATTDISHDFPSKVTSYPVEDKSTVSDHVVNQNPRFRVSGVVSDAVLDVRSIPNKMEQKDARDFLLATRDAREVVTLLTPLDIYEDLIIVNVSFPKSAGQGTALFIDVEFEKIRRVSNELTTVFVGSSNTSSNGDSNPKTSGDTKSKTSTEVNGGTKKAEQQEEGIVSRVILTGNTSTNPLGN